MSDFWASEQCDEPSYDYERPYELPGLDQKRSHLNSSNFDYSSVPHQHHALESVSYSASPIDEQGGARIAQEQPHVPLQQAYSDPLPRTSIFYGRTMHYTQQVTRWETTDTSVGGWAPFPTSHAPSDTSLASHVSHYDPQHQLPPPWAPPFETSSSFESSSSGRSHRRGTSFDSTSSFASDISSFIEEAIQGASLGLEAGSSSLETFEGGGLGDAKFGGPGGGDVSHSVPPLYERSWEEETGWGQEGLANGPEWQRIGQLGPRTEVGDERGYLEQLDGWTHFAGAGEREQEEDRPAIEQQPEHWQTDGAVGDSSQTQNRARVMPNSLGLVIPLDSLASSESSASPTPLFTPVRRGAPPLSLVPASPFAAFSSPSPSQSPVRPRGAPLPPPTAAPRPARASPSDVSLALFRPFAQTAQVYRQGQVWDLNADLIPPPYVWDEELNAWLGYRRNHASLSARIQLPPASSPAHLSSSCEDGSQITRFTATVSASTSNSLDVPLLQLDTSRKLDRATTVAPATFLLSPSATSTGGQARADFSRIQFKTSTSNHPSGASSIPNMTPNFTLLVRVDAITSDGALVEVGRWESEALVIRGRSPKNWTPAASTSGSSSSTSSSVKRPRGSNEDDEDDDGDGDWEAQYLAKTAKSKRRAPKRRISDV